MTSTEIASNIQDRSAFAGGFYRKWKFAAALIVLLCNPLFLVAQSAIAAGESQKVSISDDDFANVAQQIKGLNDPTFRAFLRVRILNWLPASEDKLRLQNALLVGTDGLVDIQSHQDQIWGPTAIRMRESIIAALTRWSPTDASTLGAKYQLKLDTQANDEAVKDFTAAIARLNDPAAGDQALANASKAILSGKVPPPVLLGELLRLDQNNSPQLPQILAATLILEEAHTGAFSLQYFNFFQHLYLKKTIPTQLQLRFLNTGIKATRLSPIVFEDAMVRGPAIQFLTAVMPAVEKLAPSLYPEAAGRLQQLSATGNAKSKDKQAAENRISNSDRPLEQTITEAADTDDKAYKRELLERAAFLARKQGKARQAVELMISREDLVAAEEDCNKYSATDQFLSEVLGTAIKDDDMETAEYAATNMRCFADRANGWRSIAVNYYQKKNVVRGQQAFSAAVKSLRSAEEGLRKARVSLALASAILRFETANSNEAFRNAVETINRLTPSDKDDKDFYSSLLPLADDVIRTFRMLAKQDLGAARALAVDIRLSELRTSATAGIESNLL